MRYLVVLDRQDLEPGEIPATHTPRRTDTRAHTLSVVLCSGKPCGHEERTGVASREYICRQYRCNPPTHRQRQKKIRTGIQQEFPRAHFDLDSTPSKSAFCTTRAEGRTGYIRAGMRQQTELDEVHKRKRRPGTKRECLWGTGAFDIWIKKKELRSGSPIKGVVDAR